MKIIESSKIKEKAYIEKLENGMDIIIIPKKNAIKKYIIWGTHFGSIDNHFIMPNTGEEVYIPDGVAHFLEHKMFEQPNGTNSLDTLMALGIDANAYTTNNHTAYLFECTDNFYEGLDELMDYVQHPYFTEENVEKEKGIIGQEIGMYDDDPGWQLYMNAMDCMYKENPIKIDIAGTVESISKITPDVLYKCYNTFYNPSNMALVVSGDFEPDKILEEIKKRLIPNKSNGEIKRIYEEEPSSIVKEKIEQTMQVSQSLYCIGIKDNQIKCKDKVKKHIAVEIILNLLFGKSSELYKKLYDDGTIYSTPSLDYEFSTTYAHVLLTGQSNTPQKVYDSFKEQINKFKQNGINKDDFERIKKKIYGTYVKEYNDVTDISRMFLADYFKGINSFDYLEEIDTVNLEYTTQILNDLFKTENMVLSVVRK